MALSLDRSDRRGNPSWPTTVSGRRGGIISREAAGKGAIQDFTLHHSSYLVHLLNSLPFSPHFSPLLVAKSIGLTRRTPRRSLPMSQSFPKLPRRTSGEVAPSNGSIPSSIKKACSLAPSRAILLEGALAHRHFSGSSFAIFRLRAYRLGSPPWLRFSRASTTQVWLRLGESSHHDDERRSDEVGFVWDRR
jgi:hypothetical protein